MVLSEKGTQKIFFCVYANEERFFDKVFFLKDPSNNYVIGFNIIMHIMWSMKVVPLLMCKGIFTFNMYEFSTHREPSGEPLQKLVDLEKMYIRLEEPLKSGISRSVNCKARSVNG